MPPPRRGGGNVPPGPGEISPTTGKHSDTSSPPAANTPPANAETRNPNADPSPNPEHQTRPAIPIPPRPNGATPRQPRAPPWVRRAPPWVQTPAVQTPTAPHHPTPNPSPERATLPVGCASAHHRPIRRPEGPSLLVAVAVRPRKPNPDHSRPEGPTLALRISPASL